MTPSFGFLLFFGVAVARECPDLAELEWEVTDAEWYVEDAQWFFDMDCPEPVPDEIRLDRVPRDLHRVECSLAGGAQQCARTTSQYRRLAKSWQSRAKRHAGSIIQRKARCDQATQELETAKAQLERAQQAVEACKAPQRPLAVASASSFQPKILYTSRPYTGPRIDVDEADVFVEAVRSRPIVGGYCQKELPTAEWRNSGICPNGRRRSIGFDIVIEFMERKGGSMWEFDFGVDFGLGGVILVDDVPVKSYAGDIWWRVKDNHPNHLGFSQTFSQGNHTLELIGAERCCDGPSRVKFCLNCNGRREEMKLVTLDALS